MKKAILGMMSGLMLLSCTESKPKTEYTITGKIPGVKDSTEVILYNAEGRKHKEIAKAVIENGTFTLTGEMNNPTECILNIAKGVKTEKGYDIYATVNLMLENDDYKISTQHIDRSEERRVGKEC